MPAPLCPPPADVSTVPPRPAPLAPATRNALSDYPPTHEEAPVALARHGLFGAWPGRRTPRTIAGTGRDGVAHPIAHRTADGRPARDCVLSPRPRVSRRCRLLRCRGMPFGRSSVPVHVSAA